MKLLLDECVTRFVKRDLSGYEVHTVEEAGFKGLEMVNSYVPRLAFMTSSSQSIKTYHINKMSRV